MLLGDEEATIAAARALAAEITPGTCLALHGELGAGKTFFSRALMRAMGVKDEAIPSPTYAIIQPYQGDRFPIAHMDWYRIDDADELLTIGVEEYLQPPWVAVIEWPERAPSLLPPSTRHLTLTIDPRRPNARHLDIG